MKKTLYVRDEDEIIWQKAEAFADKPLSLIIADGLREFVAKKELEAQQKTAGNSGGL